MADSGLMARARAWLAGQASASQAAPTAEPEGQGSQNEPEAPVGGLNGSAVTTAADLVMALCRRFEGFRAKAYLCPAGVWTIGYGATTYLDGRPVRPSDPPVTPAAADRLLERQVNGTYLPGAVALVPTADTAGRQAALADFAFNLGLTRLKASTLRRKALAGDWDAVASELQKWVYGGGVRLPGLVARRRAEADLL